MSRMSPPSFSKYFRQMEILSGIEDYLKSRGMYVTFHSTGDRESRSEILPRQRSTAKDE